MLEDDDYIGDRNPRTPGEHMGSVHIIRPDAVLPQYFEYLEQAYVLRHKVFVEGFGWKDVAKPDGRETDEFDKGAFHFVYISDRKVLGYLRLLPTTEPHLLSVVFSDLCKDSPPVGPEIWEASRIFILPTCNATITTQLVLAMMEWCLENGVTTIVAEIDIKDVVKLYRYFPDITFLGKPKKVADDEYYVALTLPIDWEIYQKIKKGLGRV